MGVDTTLKQGGHRGAWLDTTVCDVEVGRRGRMHRHLADASTPGPSLEAAEGTGLVVKAERPAKKCQL